VAKVALLGTLDSRGAEFAFVRSCLTNHGIETIVVDAGDSAPIGIVPDISRQEVAAAAGWNSLLLETEERTTIVDTLARGAANVLTDLNATEPLAGVFTLGESAAATIGTRAMRSLPFGVPKVLLSTVVAGDTRLYLGGSDIIMFNPVVEIAGLNRISIQVLTNAANALAGMVRGGAAPYATDKMVVSTTVFSLTSGAADAARARLEHLGYEVLAFHPIGWGGDSMEAMVRSGLIKGVLDITTTELADLVVGGHYAPAPSRLEAAGDMGIPQVVSLGALDMVNFGQKSAVPARYDSRLLLSHTPFSTLMRTTAEECERIGVLIADKLNRARGPVTLMVPLRGFSGIDTAGGLFEDPEADQALIDAICNRVDSWVEVLRLDNHINDHEFGVAMADRLHHWLSAGVPIESTQWSALEPDPVEDGG
jgi:uncharacterized protein (UPF0261 family)